MGRILHSNVACVNAVRHISDERQKKLVASLLKRWPKCELLLDEATPHSNVCCLTVYVRIQLPEMDNPINVVPFLTELAGQTAEAVCKTLLHKLRKHQIDGYFLSERLVSVSALRWRCCDARP
jgi:hypothetical protein